MKKYEKNFKLAKIFHILQTVILENNLLEIRKDSKKKKTRRN